MEETKTKNKDIVKYFYETVVSENLLEIVEHGGAVNTFDTLLEHNLIKPV